MRPRCPNIVLIGFMGTGKTVLGRTLAALIGYLFRDCDSLIEKAERKSITKIFLDEGEGYFRRREAETLRRLLGLRKVVISSGGGIVLLEENRRRLKKKALVIWIKASQATLRRRLSRCTNRPLLCVKDRAKQIRTLMKMRERLYRSCADVTVRNDHATTVKALSQVMQKLKAHGIHVTHPR